MFSFKRRQRILANIAVFGFVCALLPFLGQAQEATPSPAATLPPAATPLPAATDRATEVSQPSETVPIMAAPLDGREGRDLSIRMFRPQSKLVVPQTPLTKASFPVVDVHTHFLYKMRHNRQALVDYVAMMDRSSIAISVSLDGQLGDQLDSHIAYLWTDYKDRFAIFTNVDWRGDGAIDNPATWACHRQGFAERTAEQLEKAVERGVSGLKVFKQLGLGYQNPDGTLVQVDDPRWDPIWAACGKLGIPVLIHTGDPPSFFDPIDERNERWEELSRHPDWSFHDPKFPRLAELFEARNRVIERHPKTTFIGAHMASSSEDLAQLGQWLDRYPNLYVDFSSRISELGRQPFTSRAFLIKHADRILFGTDGPWPPERLRYYWRFLETHDEAFPYSEKVPPPQGLWSIYGIDLPDDVLRKIYHENAAKIVPGIKERLARWSAQTTPTKD